MSPEVDGSDPWPGQGVKYRGIGILKSPTDLWRQGEIIWKTKPDIVVETGTWRGGSAYWYASFGPVVHTVDIAHTVKRRGHAKNVYYNGSSTDPKIFEKIKEACEGKRVMVVLDSDHSKDHVLAELDLYAPLVTEGCYLIVEDTTLYPGNGPGEALEEWLPDHPEFEQQDFQNTDHPGGWLLRCS